jgi:5-methylcytosine-specific restriction endonuclease McrA
VPANPFWTKQWRHVRRQILDRDGRTCQLQYPGCTGRATHVDHVTPRRYGGTDHPDNLRAACARCNLRRGDGTDPPGHWASSW